MEELMEAEETPGVMVVVLVVWVVRVVRVVRLVRVGVCVTSSTPLLSPVVTVTGSMSPLYCVWS